MGRASSNILESEVEDALIGHLDILKEVLGVAEDVRLITRQLRLVDGKKRLDILVTVGHELFLVELKTEPFQRDQVRQVLGYKQELERLQEKKKLVPGKIVAALLVTDFKREDLDACEAVQVKIFKYSPMDILVKYYERVADVAKFMKIKPVDLGIFNIALVNRVLKGLDSELITSKDLASFSHLSPRSVSHHLSFATELGLASGGKGRYYLTDLGRRYTSLEDPTIAGDVLSPEQASLLREHIAKDPFSSPVVFGIYTIVESMFFLARSGYPVGFEELKHFFLETSGKKNEWQTAKGLSTATYSYLNYAIKLGLLGKVGRKVLMTPSGFRFILMLQLHKSIEMIDTLLPQNA